MKKIRKAISQKQRTEILREFNHRCAICGKENPQIHHIDENPSNNESLNLVPLCPNCHLIDQHNPTAPINFEKLKLFRKHKDPAILKSQFDPLFKRMQFLNPLDKKLGFSELAAHADELADFVAAFQMGEFYSKRVASLIVNYSRMPSKDGKLILLEEIGYDERIEDKYPEVSALVVEMLRYQKW